MYETLYNKAKEMDVDLIKADFNRFTGKGNNLEKSYNKLCFSDCYYNIVINPQKDFTPFKFIMNTWSGIYKRYFLEKNKIRHNETPGASFQDNGFWFQTFMFASKIYFIDKPFYMNRRDNPNSSVKNREKVYAFTEEYKFIRNVIDNNPDLQKFIGVYWVAKFRNYVFNLRRIDKKFHHEFMQVFINEFKQAKNNNEIDFKLFDDYGLLDSINLLYKNPNKFYRKRLGFLSFPQKLFSVTNSWISTIKFSPFWVFR